MRSWATVQVAATLAVAVGQSGVQPGPAAGREPVVAPPREPAGAVERVVAVPAPGEGVLLDPAADLVEGVEAELADVEGVEHADSARSWSASAALLR